MGKGKLRVGGWGCVWLGVPPCLGSLPNQSNLLFSAFPSAFHFPHLSPACCLIHCALLTVRVSSVLMCICPDQILGQKDSPAFQLRCAKSTEELCLPAGSEGDSALRTLGPGFALLGGPLGSCRPLSLSSGPRSPRWPAAGISAGVC